MGLISGAINDAMESMGTGMLDAGSSVLKGSFSFWKSASDVTVSFAAKDPMSQANAWAIVTGNIYNMSLAIAASLAVLYFVMGWLRESIDIRNTFTLENLFRFFVRYIITASLIVNSLALVTGISQCASAVVTSVSVSIEEAEPGDVFEDLKTELEDDEDADGGTWMSYGLIGFLGGVLGGVVIIVCGVSLVISVLSRLFKILLVIPFAPVAFAGFAGGHEFSQTGIAWLKTFIGYCLEAVVIALAINISFGLFKDASLFTGSGSDGIITMILTICNYCMPMIVACSCVKGADMMIRRCLGLG